MKEPVLVVSDLHLGLPASRIEAVAQLRPLLEGAATVIFNGDTWQELSREFCGASAGMLEELKALVAELGAEAVFLSGNHDPGWPGKGWLELAGGKVVVTHGDAVMWAGSPWSREALERMEKIRELWEEHRGAGEDAAARLALAREMAVALRAKSVVPGRSFFRRVVDALNPPRRAWEIARVWWGQAGAAQRFAERYFPECEVLAIGHFHRPGLWRRGGRILINTGAHVAPLGARWIEWRGGELRVGPVVTRADGSFGRGEGEVVWRQGALG